MRGWHLEAPPYWPPFYFFLPHFVSLLFFLFFLLGTIIAGALSVRLRLGQPLTSSPRYRAIGAKDVGRPKEL